MLGFINDNFVRELTNEIRSGYERTSRVFESYISQLKTELESERLAHAETRQLLTRALRLEPRQEVQTGEAKPHLEPLGRAKSWPRLQQELEQIHRRKDADETVKYWADKQAAMSKESSNLDEALKLVKETKQEQK
jgi:hypothetical protein